MKSLGLKIDFHVHTCYSHDSSITLKEVVTYSKKQGMDGVVITDHNTVKGALKLKTREILVVPGIEVSTSEGHLLGINVSTLIPSKLSIEETIHRIHEAGGVAVAPHPFAFYRSPPSRYVRCYDAIEVLNASSIPFSIFSSLSKMFAEDLGLPQTGGSDSHFAPEIGSAYTVVDASLNVDAVIDAIEHGAIFPIGRGIPWKTRLKRTALNLKKKV